MKNGIALPYQDFAWYKEAMYSTIYCLPAGIVCDKYNKSNKVLIPIKNTKNGTTTHESIKPFSLTKEEVGQLCGGN